MADEKGTRKCANWLVDFAKWTLPRSEAPETFIFWTGLFTLASAVRRHVKIPRSMFGSWEASPNLYILFIAPAGKARKSTTANYTEELLDYVPGITKSPELITKEMLLSTLVKSDDASMCIVAPEFGEFIVKSGPEMYGFLTNMYDGKKKISAATIGRGTEFAERPCINLLGATTPEWVAENMPESVIGGGFASRVIFVFEERVRRRKMYYKDLDYQYLELLRTNLVHDLNHIALNCNGEFAIEPEAEDFMEEWYGRTADEGGVAEYKLHGYYERRPAHVHKVAMLLHLAYSDELILCKRDFVEAIALMKQIEQKLPQTFQAIGKNKYTVDMGRILDFVKEKGRVEKVELFRKFFHAAQPGVLQELVEGLGTMGLIHIEVEGMNVFYSANGVIKSDQVVPESYPRESHKA